VLSPIFLIFTLVRDKQNFFLGAVVLALPLARMTFFLGSPPQVFHASGAQSVAQINLVDLLLLGAILHGAFLERRKLSNHSKLFVLSAISVFGFLAWCGLSIVFGHYKILGFISLIDLLKVFLLWYYIASHVNSEEDVDRVVGYLLIGLALEGAIGVYQAFYGFPEWATPIAKGDPTTLERLDTGSFLRVGGTIGWTTVFAQYLCLLIPLALAKLASASSWRSALGFSLCSILAITSLFLTLSRAGWASLAIALAVIGVLLFRYGHRQIRIRLIAALGGVLVLALSFSPLMMERFESYDYGSAAARLPMMRVAWNIIRANPIFGTGLNSYSEIMHQYDPQGLIAGFEYAVHNIYLFIAAEVGIPGLAFFLAFVGLIMFSIISVIREGPEYLACISAGLVGGVIALMTHGLVEQGMKADIQLWYVFSAVSGLGIAIHKIWANSKFEAHSRGAGRV